MSALGAIILAGGQSSRMGADKALIRWNGKRAIDLVADLAKKAGAVSLVVAGPDYGLPAIPDRTAFNGPAEALFNAAGAMPDVDRLIVLAVDAPTILPEDLADLLDAPDPGAVFCGFPLPMVIARRSFAKISGCRALRDIVTQAGLHSCFPSSSALARIRGANTPAELKALASG